VDAGELSTFAASVAGVTARRWGRAADAAGADLAALWTDGAAQGWFGLAADDALDAALAAIGELGRAACPLPVMDAFVAARRAHEMAVEHATTRRQFGKVIGGFGAVQQRTASCQIDVSAAEHLLRRAAGAYAGGSTEWVLAAEIAVEFIAAAERRVQLGAQHTLAAMGYFEEHDAPWLFRRVHGDITRLHTLPLQAGQVADILAETGAAAIGATATGSGARLEAPMAGVLGGELAEEFGEAMLDILGPRGALSGEVPGTPGGGAFEYGLRLSIMYVVGGGTNDIQRGLIARGLGLPR
jgi:alkylation response protein AidB-like acyl-CoA dehydrogenase